MKNGHLVAIVIVIALVVIILGVFLSHNEFFNFHD
jgi:hypothetical protein